jgi:threonine/homoserine efflux transporter RhtA
MDSDEPIDSRLRRPGAAALLVAGTVHVPPVPEHVHEAPYIGVLFIALAAACAVLAFLLARRDSVAIWAVTTVLAAAAALAYVVSRTVGLPQIHDDTGNWSDPLGAIALTTETTAAAIGAFVLDCHLRHRRFQPPVDTGDRSLEGKDPHR